MVKKEKIVDLLSLVILFLFGLNFNSNVLLWLLAMFIPVVVLTGNRVIVRGELLLLFVTMMTYFIFGSNQNIHVAIRYLVGPSLFFYFGYLYSRKSHNDFSRITNCIYALAIGFALQQFLTLYINFSTASNRYIPDFWNGELIQPTNFNSRGIFIIALSYYAIRHESRKVQKTLLIGAICTVLLSSIMTASRTNLYFFVAFFVLDYFVESFILKKLTPKELMRNRLTKKRVVFVCIIALICGIICYRYSEIIIQWFLRSAIVERQESNAARFSLSNDPRWILWKDTIKMLWSKPMGDPTAMYAHNLILDTGRVAGVIPMFLMLSFSCCQLHKIVNFCFHKSELPLNQRVFIFSVLLCLFMSFMIEPVLEGRPFVFVGACMIFGIALSFKDNI